MLCSLLGIQDQNQLQLHYARGAIFENLIISEIIKQFYNQGKQAPLYFWRDKLGREVDVIIEDGSQIIPIEIKSSKTINKDFFANLDYFKELAKLEKGYLVCAGEEFVMVSGKQVINWTKNFTLS